MRITRRFIQSLTLPDRGNRVVWDDKMNGLGVRVTAGGAIAFVLRYINESRHERRLTIGRYPGLTCTAAREAATGLLKRIAAGEDPLAQREELKNAPTMHDLCDSYLETHAVKKRTFGEDQRKIEKIIRPRLGKRKVLDITYDEIEGLHRSMKSTPYQANRLLALLGKMFSISIRKRWRPDNPCKGVEWYPEEPRQRYLTIEELSRLAQALAEHPNTTSANAIRLMLLTGARRGEVLNATWDQFHMDTAIWIKPSSHTKQKRRHEVPLSPAAQTLLLEMKARTEGEHVFPGRVPGEPLKEIKRFWAAICKTAELKNARMHDLRHSFASVLASSGYSLHLIGQLLGHTKPQSTARYAHLFDDPLREATGRVGALFDALEGGSSGEVVPLRRGSDAG